MCGEYAVLDKAVAISMAIDRRVHVSVEANMENHHVLHTRGVVNGERVFQAEESGLLSWSDGKRSELLEAVWQELQLTNMSPLRIGIDSGEFCDASSGAKYGFGSSAAATASGIFSTATA